MSKAKWFNPMFDIKDKEVSKDLSEKKDIAEQNSPRKYLAKEKSNLLNINNNSNNKSNWMKQFEPTKLEDLAVHNKKVKEVEDCLCRMCEGNHGEILLLSGPVGCGKTATVYTLASKYNIKVTEWTTPVDIDIPTEYGDYEYREKQSTKFLDFIINSANFTSLVDNNSKKIVVVEDFPNTFLKTPPEFTTMLQQYKERAKSPIVFVCSETHTDNKNNALSLFTPALKDQFNIHHIVFNSISPTGLRSALKRVSDIISKKFASSYTTPSMDLIECVLNSSMGDVRSAVLNLHFACIKGVNNNLDTSIVEKEHKTKTAKKRKLTSKFNSIGKDDSVSILHGVGRVLNPKRTESGEKFIHDPLETINQFLGQSGSFISFLAENYLPHFGCIENIEKAAADLSTADYLMTEWREKYCQEYGLYVAVTGIMLSNKNPVSAWNPVRGPKKVKVQYPSIAEFPQLEPNILYKGKVLVSDYKTYCNIIGNKANNTIETDECIISSF